MSDFLRNFAKSHVALVNAIVAILSFFFNPFIARFTPAEFVPPPEPPAVVVEKPVSIADYRIIYGADAIAAEINAAKVLADTLNQITGLNYVAEQGVPTGSNEFLIGQISGEDSSHLGADGFLIKANGDSIAITGGRPRGVLYGVYNFLQQYFDCRWYTRNIQVIPEGPPNITPVQTWEYEPPMEYREMDWLSRDDWTYSVANGLNGSIYRNMPESLGGTFGYSGYNDSGAFAHTMVYNFVKPAEFFDSHPDWYAYRESSGTRVPHQLCLTNPEVLAQLIKEVRQQLENGNGQPIVSVTQEDNEDYCECPECKRIDTEEGSCAGTMLRFVNAVARDIAEDYPEVRVDTFAYQYTRTPPKYVRPEPNVIVRLCSIECCFAHTLDDPKCEDNVSFASDIKRWSELTDQLYIWDYTTNYDCFLVMHPNFHVLQRNMQFFVENNVKGIYVEGNHQSDESNVEFSELRGYLIARLLWNPNTDFDADMNGFLKAYYGDGWQYLREFIDIISSNAGQNGAFQGLGKSATLFVQHRKLSTFTRADREAIGNYNERQIRYMDQLWEKAIAFASDQLVGTGTETYKEHVLRSRICWRFWKAVREKGEFNRYFNRVEEWQAENEKLYYDIKGYGVTRYSEGWDETYRWRFLPEAPADWWGTPLDWRG